MFLKFIKYIITFLPILYSNCFIIAKNKNSYLSDSVQVDHIIKLSDYYYSLNTDSAMFYADSALKLSMQINDSLNVASCINRIGLIYKTKGEYDSALIHLSKALKIREQLGDSLKVSSSLENIGNIHKKRGKCDTALLYYRKSQKIKERLNALEYLGSVYNGIASTYKCLGKLDSVDTYQLKSLGIYKALKDTLKIAKLYNNRGNFFYQNGNYSKARASYQKAIEYYELIGSILGQAESNYNLALVCKKERHIQQSIQHYQKSIRLYNQVNSKEYLQLVHESLSDTYYQMGNLAKAYEHFQISVLYKDSIFNEKSVKIIEELETKYQTEKKEQALKLSRESEALAKAENKMKETTIYILIASILIILIIAFFILRLYWQRKELAKKELALRDQKINRLLKEQELKSYSAMLEGQDAERKRIAEDLHDRLGSVLSTVKLHFQSVGNKIEELKIHNLDQYQKANELLDKAVTEVRNIAHNLASGVLVKFGLEAALRDLKESIESGSKLKIHLYFNGLKDRLDTNTEIELYRILQELFSNTLRHARAEFVHLQLNQQNGNLNIIFEDNGEGFDPESIKKGMGLKNIETRTSKLNGSVSFDSTKGKGTTIIIDIPVNND